MIFAVPSWLIWEDVLALGINTSRQVSHVGNALTSQFQMSAKWTMQEEWSERLRKFITLPTQKKQHESI